MILLDTHVWIWLNSDPDRLSASSRERLRLAPQIAISSVSIYETILAAEKGRLENPFSPEGLVRRWLMSMEVHRIPVGDEIAILGRTLAFEHGDPFDRLIASTAFHENVPLMTADRHLLRLNWLATLPAQ